ncbi:MAG: sulfatase-like hydrolase/transferase [Chloroflexi bacterium]|nr:sulfatase-like hydrolase/transferase [Chloroflexota bacterium]
MLRYRKFILSFIVFAFLLQACQALPRLNDKRPNFLIIITDDQRFDTMEYMPNTRQLIFDQGVTFSRGYITTPFCCPSRASILTGLYAHNHYVHVNEDKLNLPTVVEDLHNNGYYTGLVGKYLNSWKGEPRSEFDYWVSFFGGTVPNYYDPNLNINGTWEKKTGYITYLFEEYVREYLDKAASQRKPFLLIFAPNAPHAPFTPLKEDKELLTDLPPFRPPNYNEEDISDKPSSIASKGLLSEEAATQIDNTRRRQLLTLIALDRSIGEIMKKLEETGELDNTVVIFISDNGKHWGEHRMDSKSTAYEESVKIPFALRYPPLVPTPYTEEGLASNIDIAPTLYELSETPMPEIIDGMSLVRLLRGEGEWRTHLLLEAWPDRGHWTAIHTGDSVYIETDNDLSEFYDLKIDPYELNNLINDPEYQSQIAELEAIMRREEQVRVAPPEK